MVSRTRLLALLCLAALSTLILVACGDPTATSAPAATPTTVPTTAAPTTAAATTAAATTAAASGATTAAAGAGTTAAGGAAGSATTAAPAPTAPLPTMAGTQEELGRQAFARTCAGCHLQQGLAGGRAPQLSTSQNAINADFVRKQVRNGGTKMPKFDQTKVSDADLENIILYLKAIHKS